MPPVTKTFDYLDHRIMIEPIAPGTWRYRVWPLVGVAGASHRRVGELLVDKKAITRWNANVRARDAVRRHSRKSARWPRRHA